MKRLSIILLCLLLALPAFGQTVIIAKKKAAGTTDFTADANCQGAWYMNGAHGGDGSQTETDRSGKGNTLSVSASDTIPDGATVPSGYSGYSRDFEGSENDFLTRADNVLTGLDINGADQPISIVVWVKVESVSTNDDGYQFIVNKWGGAGIRQYVLGLDYTGAGTFAFFGGVSSDGTDENTVISTTTNYAVDTWYHVAIVYNDTDVRLYVNGSLDCSPLANSEGIYNSSTAFGIGVLVAVTSYGEFDGLIDEPGVFDRELSAVEVAAIYANGISGNKGGSD